jgi:general secretion pathway protein E
MVHEDFNQIAVQPQIGVTFSTILRNILRQDPDVVMIGEIRDQETAKYAVQAALTGHLVFSTLHTNDAAGAITRLEDLGLPPYLISSTLLGVVAQRLIRMNCPRCKEPVKVTREELASFNCRAGGNSITAYYGQGCNFCRHTGYKGRIGIYEVLAVDEEIKAMIHEEAGEQAIKAVALKKGMTSLKQDACRKLAAGITTLREIIRVTS